jgi:hypothetical protein
MEDHGLVLLGWLRLMGWTVRIERAGDHWLGSATHVEAGGAELRVGGRARSHGDLVWTLFRRVTGKLERTPRERALLS